MIKWLFSKDGIAVLISIIAYFILTLRWGFSMESDVRNKVDKDEFAVVKTLVKSMKEQQEYLHSDVKVVREDIGEVKTLLIQIGRKNGG